MTYRSPVRYIILTTLILSISNIGIAAAVDNSPTAFLKSKDKKLKPLLAKADQNKKKILTIINNMMDFDALAKTSLGKHWGTRTPAEQKEFSETLKALIEKNLVKRLKSSTDHIISYGTESVAGESAKVSTTVKAGTGPRAEETEVVYELHKKGGKWIVIDMITDEVSLVNNYQSQFNKIITDEGWTALMKKMTDKLAEQE